jgi:hypothetical protein
MLPIPDGRGEIVSQCLQPLDALKYNLIEVAYLLKYVLLLTGVHVTIT